MKKDFAEEKLKNFFDGGENAGFKITSEMEDTLKNLPERKKPGVPLYRRKAFISAAASFCIILLCAIIPQLADLNLKSGALNDALAPESNYKGDSFDMYSALRAIVLQGSIQDGVSGEKEGNDTTSAMAGCRLTVDKSIQYTVRADGGYLQGVCGLGQLNAAVLEISLYNEGAPKGKTSLIIIQGTAGNFWSLGKTGDISAGTLEFSSKNSYTGIINAPAVPDKICLTLDKGNNLLNCAVNGGQVNGYIITACGGTANENYTINF